MQSTLEKANLLRDYFASLFQDSNGDNPAGLHTLDLPTPTILSQLNISSRDVPMIYTAPHFKINRCRQGKQPVTQRNGIPNTAHTHCDIQWVSPHI